MAMTHCVYDRKNTIFPGSETLQHLDFDVARVLGEGTST
jgi:hypothetical protein